MAADGRWMDALKLIKQDNPFPAVCGDVCNRRCETECTRGTIDQPVAIDEVKKYIAAKELAAETRYVPICENDEGKMWGPDYRMAVIGAGPAGMSCAYYLREKGYDVTVFERNERPGGTLAYGIPNFRLEKDVLNAEIDVLRQMGVEFRCGVTVGEDVTIADLRKEGYKAFYLAIGLQGGRKAGVPGEDAHQVLSGVSFLRDVCEGKLTKLSGNVVVVGGGNVAVDVARTAVRLTDGTVTMLCLEGEKEMPAAADEVAEAVEEGILVRNGWGPKEVLTEDEAVTGVIFKRCTRVKDDNGRFHPEYDESQTITVPCTTVLLAIGQSAEWNHLLDGTKVKLGRGWTAETDPVTFQTGEPDIFAGADGKKAAESMHRFVHPGQSLTIARDLREFTELNKDNIVVESYDTAKRSVPGKKHIDPVTTFEDTRLPLTDEQVRTEARRCLGCGATIVDENRCIGCGLCTTRCEFDAIHLHRELPHASDMVRTEDKFKKIGPYAAQREIKIIKKKLEKK